MEQIHAFAHKSLMPSSENASYFDDVDFSQVDACSYA
jgi:hypothetical protein